MRGFDKAVELDITTTIALTVTSSSMISIDEKR